VSEAVSFSSLRPHLAYLTPPHIELVEKAFDIARQAHEGQTRVSGEPYITHPLEVTKILTTYYMDHVSIIAGLLHDTIEDTAVTKQEIINDFGDQVAMLVDGLSKLKKAEFKTRQAAQGENFRKMLLAMAKDIRVIIIKLADRLHNMRTLHVLSHERKTRIATETLDIFSPIARRLGMHSVSLELESLGFKALYPKRYEVLTRAIAKVESQHHDIMEKILNKIRNQLKKQKIKIVALGSRKKNIYSIYRKMKRKGVSFAQLTDVYGARVIVDDREDVYHVLGLMHQLYLPVSEKFKDYVAVPKPNGYQSLHTVLLGPSGVPIEIQIRTRTMDDTASNGIASHWIYKTQEMDNQEHKWLASLIDIQTFTQNPEEFIENVKMDLFKDEVYVFTPVGEIIELPSDATAMDFAYAVHTDIGDHCVAAKVDRQLAPLSMVLSNGQTVEIITSKHAQPSAVWLDVVVTPKAKTCINNFLKNQYKQQSIQLGRK
jgi:guanosine-3',5'-bis(diphosphate) 3'-pyrophosphohydrolase